MDIDEKGGLPWTRNLSPHSRAVIICLLAGTLSTQILEEIHLLPAQIRADDAKAKFEKDDIKGYCERSHSGQVTLYNYIGNNPNGSPIVSAAYTTDSSFAEDDDLTDFRIPHRSLSSVFSIKASAYLPKETAIYTKGTNCIVANERDIAYGRIDNTYYNKQEFFLLFNGRALPPQIPHPPLLLAEEEIIVQQAIQQGDEALAHPNIHLGRAP